MDILKPLENNSFQGVFGALLVLGNAKPLVMALWQQLCINLLCFAMLCAIICFP